MPQKSSFYLFFCPPCVCWMLLFSFVIRWGWRLLSLLSKVALTRVELEASDPFGDVPPAAKKTSLLSEVVILTLVSFKWEKWWKGGGMWKSPVDVIAQYSAKKWLWEHTWEGTRDHLGPTKWANIFTLVGKADFFSMSRKKQKWKRKGVPHHSTQASRLDNLEVKHYRGSQHLRCTSVWPSSPSCNHRFWCSARNIVSQMQVSRHDAGAPQQLRQCFSLNSYRAWFFVSCWDPYMFTKWKHFHKPPHSIPQIRFASLSHVNIR